MKRAILGGLFVARMVVTGVVLVITRGIICPAAGHSGPVWSSGVAWPQCARCGKLMYDIFDMKPTVKHGSRRGTPRAGRAGRRGAPK